MSFDKQHRRAVVHIYSSRSLKIIFPHQGCFMKHTSICLLLVRQSFLKADNNKNLDLSFLWFQLQCFRWQIIPMDLVFGLYILKLVTHLLKYLKWYHKKTFLPGLWVILFLLLVKKKMFKQSLASAYLHLQFFHFRDTGPKLFSDHHKDKSVVDLNMWIMLRECCSLMLLCSWNWRAGLSSSLCWREGWGLIVFRVIFCA